MTPLLGLAVLLTVFTPIDAQAEDPAPKSVDDFVEQRAEYSYGHICADQSGKVGWLMFHKRGTLTEGVRFIILSDRVIGPEPVTFEKSTQATIDTGDYMGTKAQSVTFLPVTSYRTKDGVTVKVVSREREDQADYSTYSSGRPNTKTASIRCTSRQMAFNELANLSKNFNATAPREAKVDDSAETKQDKLHDYLWRQVRPVNPDAKTPAK